MEIGNTNIPKQSSFMEKNHVKRIATIAAIMLITMVNATKSFRQVKVDDKEIIGVWIMSSMKFEGENKELISENYNQVKVYRANGEYACAEIMKNRKGQYIVAPHEYGTYYLKNGQYSEMGRKPIPFNWVTKTTTKGRWMNRIDAWKKVTDMPEELTQHIVDKCKAAQPSSENMQKMMKKYIFQK